LPIGSEDVINVDDPPFSVTVLLGSGLPPTWKVTVPVGVPPPANAATLAVSVTLCPLIEVAVEEEIVTTATGVAETVTVATEDVLATKFASPLYTPVIF
jgi:hypothetical protein